VKNLWIPSIIILDNAAYHVVLGPNIPIGVCQKRKILLGKNNDNCDDDNNNASKFDDHDNASQHPFLDDANDLSVVSV
jgi:hypothetical protein